MKQLTISDLHLDFWEDRSTDPLAGFEGHLAELDLLLIAGDLSNKPQRRWERFLSRLVEITRPNVVKIFPGNHDFYQYRIDAEDRLAEFASNAGAEYVNRKVITRGGLRYICATLWTDFKLPPGRTLNEVHIPTRMNDYRVIRHAGGGYRRLWPKDTIAIHHKDLNFIAEALQTPFEGRSIVVTHHAPHPDVLAEYSENLNAAYASDLTNFIETNRPDAWLFGHSHDAKALDIAGCRIQNISLGYPFEIDDPKARIEKLIQEQTWITSTS